MKAVQFLTIILFIFVVPVKCQISNKSDQVLRTKDGRLYFVKFNSEQVQTNTNNFHKLLEKYYNISDKDSFSLYSEQYDKFDYCHQKYQHYYKGIKVEYSKIYVHSFNGKITSINGLLEQPDNLSTLVSISANQLETSLNSITKNFNPQKYADLNLSLFREPELMFFKENRTNTLHLGYKFVTRDLNTGIFYTIYISCESGQAIEMHRTELGSTATASAYGRYNGTVQIKTWKTLLNKYKLEDRTRGNGIYINDLNESQDLRDAVAFEDSDNNWSYVEYHNQNKDDAALDAMYALENIYDYFSNKHDWDSYDGDDAEIYCLVHYGSGENNSFWNPELNNILIGDGDSISYDAFCSIDILAHEFTHGISEELVEFDLEGESGSINEAMSDIFAACIEAEVDGQISEFRTWHVMEDVVFQTLVPGDIYCIQRSMRNPSDRHYYDGQLNIQPYPDQYEGDGWVDPTNELDDGGVHINSTVLSHMFYLMVEGGSLIDDDHCYYVEGIGMDAAADIVFYVLKNYLTSNSTMVMYANALNVAAEVLFGQNSFESYQVAYARYAVNLISSEPSVLITGTDILCYPNDGEFSTFPNLPQGTTYSWNKSAYLNIVSGQGTDTYVVEPGTSSNTGTETVYLTYNAGCGNVSISKDLWINKPENATGHSATPPGPQYCQGAAIDFFLQHNNPSIAGITTYNWNVDGSSSTSTYNHKYVHVGTQIKSTSLYVTMTNTCGTTSPYYYYYSIIECGGPPPPVPEQNSNSALPKLKLSPNPANTYLNIAFDKPVGSLIEKNRFAIYNSNSGIVMTGHINGESEKIYIGNFNAGVYILSVTIDGNIIQEKFVVSK